MRRAKVGKVGAVVVASAAVGFGASALGTAGADTAKHRDDRAGKHERFDDGRGPGLHRAVHAEAVVPFKGQFVTVTLDRGFVQKVEGKDLTIREGTKNLTYKTVTLTIPDGAKVRNDGHPSNLSDLQAGEHVVVIQGPKRTRVLARHVPSG
jgi:hypothetical protein